jgi:hypothetical protein
VFFREKSLTDKEEKGGSAKTEDDSSGNRRLQVNER